MFAVRQDVNMRAWAEEEAVHSEILEHGDAVTKTVAAVVVGATQSKTGMQASAQKEAVSGKTVQHGDAAQKTAAAVVVGNAQSNTGKQVPEHTEIFNSKAVQRGHAAKKTMAAVVAGTAAAQSRTGSATAGESERHEDIERMCKLMNITIIQASGLPAKGSAIDPYVFVQYRTKSDMLWGFQTNYMAGVTNPTWNDTQKVLLCNKTATVHFSVYDSNWFFDTLLAKIDLSASHFWGKDFEGDLKLEDGNNNTSILHIRVSMLKGRRAARPWRRPRRRSKSQPR